MNELKAAVSVLGLGTIAICLFILALWIIHWIEWLRELIQFGNADSAWPPWPLRQETDDD